MASSSETQAYWKQIQQNYFKSQVASERYIRRLAWILLFGLIAYSFYLLNNRSTAVSLYKANLALGVVWLGFLPTIQYLFDRNRPPMPFLPLVGLFYATGYGLPVFASKEALTVRVSVYSITNVSEESIMMAFLGLAGLNIAFFISKYTVWQKVSSIRFVQAYPISKLLSILWALLLLNFGLRYIPFLQSIPSLGQFVIGARYVVFGMFYILWSRKQLPKSQAWLLLIVFAPLEIMPRLISGLLAEVMILFLFMFIVSWYERKRIPIVLISVLAVFYLGLAPVKAEFRTQTWNDSAGAKLNPIEKAQLFFNLAFEFHQKYTFNFDSKIQSAPKASALDKAAERSAQITLLSKVIKETPKIVPYWNGETYLPLFTGFIPRIVWPDKPEILVANQFGHRYGYIATNDRSTSINLPWLVEMYANFGYWGVMLGMPLVGIFLALIDRKLNGPNMNALEFVVGCSACFNLVYQELNFALMVNTLIPFLVSMFILFKFFLPYRKHRHMQ
jgi:hypothetical protein